MTAFRKAQLHGAAFTLEGHYYTSEQVYRAECDQIFAQQWFVAGRAEQIPNAGDYFLVNWLNESAIVVRDRSGVIRAHHNVCRHRGTRMCEAERGQFSGTIQCPYHAWTYALDGRLVAARQMGDVEGFDKADYPLFSVALAEWEGFILLNFAQQPKPFEQAYAPLINKWPDWQMPKLRVAATVTYDVAANWKLIVQNYSECYHCPLIHPALVELSPPTSGRNDLDEGPFLGGYMDLNADIHTMAMNGGTITRPPVGDVHGADLHHVYYYSLFPNMLLSLHPDYVMFHTLWPTAPGRTKIVCEWLFDPELMKQPGFDASDAVEFWDMTNQQDWRVSELTQLGVGSRVFTPGPYAQSEGLLAAFDRYYLKQMGVNAFS